MIKASVIKIYPDDKQKEIINKTFCCCRFIYNKSIEINQKKYHRTGKGLSGFDMAKYIPKLKKQYPFLKDALSQSLQISCYNLAEAYLKFFRKKAGYPKFKKKGIKDSFSFINGLKLNDNKIDIPKCRWIKYRGGNNIEGKIISATVSRKANKYYASILFDDLKPIPEKKKIKKIVGIDMGLNDFIYLSNGEYVKPNPAIKEQERKVKIKQKELSRKKLGSNNRNKAKKLLQKEYIKLSNIRKDFNHKLSRKLIDSGADSFSFENLNIQGMLKNRKVSHSIVEKGWYQFKIFMKYKTERNGKHFLEVNRFFPSTKTCSKCGIVKENLPLSERTFKCDACDNQVSRDLNAAINIAYEGLRNSPCGENVRLGDTLLYQKAIFCEARSSTD